MATLAAYWQPFSELPIFKGLLPAAKPAPTLAAPLPHESAAFLHALAALSAKLAAIDGPVTKAEYHAFEALFAGTDPDQVARLRSQFLKHLSDRSPALQFARQLAEMTRGNAALHRDLLQRLLVIATADAALNAVEMELLRAVAEILGIEGEEFCNAVARHQVPATSPYKVLGVSPYASDEAVRTAYMALVQRLHPDRFAAAGASAETVALLSDQLAAVNAAYQQLRAQRARKAGASFFGRRYAKGAKAEAA